MSSPWPPSTMRVHVLDAHARRLGEEALEARAVEHAGHADAPCSRGKPVTFFIS